MAKTLLHLKNNIRVKYLVKVNGYVLFYGSQQITIDGEYFDNYFYTQEEAEEYGNRLTQLNKADYTLELTTPQ